MIDMLQSVRGDLMKKINSIQAVLHDQISIPSQLISNYHAVGLDEKELILVLKIYQFQVKDIFFPTPDQIAADTTFNQQECTKLLRQLIQKGLLSIEEDSQNDRSLRNERYSLEPLFDQLYYHENTNQDKQTNEDQMNIFILFEQEFGRVLSPIEIETINIWIDDDQQEPALIKAALREAVLMNKLNFKYIDRILREWKKKGIQTVDQARAHSKTFHGAQSHVERKSTDNNRDRSLYYNWLEDD